MTVRVLSALSIACIATAIGLVVFGEDQNAPVIVVLILATVGITSLLGLRAAYLKMRGIVSDASAFMTGRVQNARLISVGDPKGIFWPKSELQLEFEGEDGKVHGFDRAVPVPFFIAWSHRFGKRFNLPFMRTDLSQLMAFELRREGIKVGVGRAGAPEPPV